VSDEVKDKSTEEKELATNRLLELLRSQQVGTRDDKTDGKKKEEKPVDSTVEVAEESPKADEDDNLELG